MRSIAVPVHETRDASYEVVVGRGALAELPRLLVERCPAHAYAVIADHKVVELHGAALLDRLAGAGLHATVFPFPPGEWNKSREQWAALTDQMVAAHVGRDGAVIAFGGGVAGDLGGFIAATYLRGLPVVQVPTTLLAMIDSSVGGKTGVDVPAGKNLVGAFHPPRAVVADIELLGTLPRTHVAAGLAEAVKHGVIADAAYFASLADAGRALARDLDRLEEIVTRSVEIKADIVAEDEREQGVRAVLNLGHTVGHAIEALSGYAVLHGEAVAIGMATEIRIAERLGVAHAGLADAVCDVLEQYALPTRLPDACGTDQLLDAMRADKKVRSGTLRLALPQDLGTMARDDDGGWTVRVDESVMRQVLDGATA